MDTLEDAVRAAAQGTDFSGVVRVDRPDAPPFAAAFGLADRAHQVSMTTGHRIAIASGSKGFTALAVMSLVEAGVLELSTTARSLLGQDLPLVADDVTVEHLLAHRSGIGDYLDDDADVSDYPLALPVHRLVRTEDFLPLLDGHPTLFPADDRFAYSNGGYVLLALLAERAGGVPYHQLVRDRVFAAAGMVGSDFLRLDELPGDAATGYVVVDGVYRTNVLHLPVLATGDGGAFTTVADMARFWAALAAGEIVSPSTVAAMTSPRSEATDGDGHYGLGFWLPTPDDVELVGCDAGSSFRSRVSTTTGTSWTVMGTTPDGAWPVARAVTAALSAA
jgi:CubicO group peptidase (beta-lactamase class C family)